MRATGPHGRGGLRDRRPDVLVLANAVGSPRTRVCVGCRRRPGEPGGAGRGGATFWRAWRPRRRCATSWRGSSRCLRASRSDEEDLRPPCWTCWTPWPTTGTPRGLRQAPGARALQVRSGQFRHSVHTSVGGASDWPGARGGAGIGRSVPDSRVPGPGRLPRHPWREEFRPPSPHPGDGRAPPSNTERWPDQEPTWSKGGPWDSLGGGWDAARVLLAPHRARDRPRGACGPPPAAPCLPGAPPPPRPAPLGPGGGGTARPAWLSWSSLQARGARGRAEADGRAAAPAPTAAGGGDAGAEAAGEHVRPEGFQHGGAGGDGAGVAEFLEHA